MPGHYNDNWEWVDDEDQSYYEAPASADPPKWQGGLPLTNVLAGHEDDWPGNDPNQTHNTTTPPPAGNQPPYPAPDGFSWIPDGRGGWLLSDGKKVGTTTSTGGTLGSGKGPYNFAQLAWPDWNPPEFAGPEKPFEYADFKPPTLEDALNEPGYKFAADEGAKRIQNNAAARGNVVSGGAIKDLVKWANDYATQNYNGVYGRGLQTYSTNRNNAADNYMTNYNVSRDVFDRKFNSYSQGNQSQRQKAQLDFQRDWDIYQSDLDTKKFLTTQGNT